MKNLFEVCQTKCLHCFKVEPNQYATHHSESACSKTALYRIFSSEIEIKDFAGGVEHSPKYDRQSDAANSYS